MAVKYVKDFMFPAGRGFHGSNKLPRAAMASEREMPARARANAPAQGAPRMEAPPKVGKAQGYDKGGPVRLRGGGTPAPGSRAFMRDVPGRGDYVQVRNPLSAFGIGPEVVNVPKSYEKQKGRIEAIKKSMPFEPGAKVTPGIKTVEQAIREFPNVAYNPAYDPRYAEQAKKAQAAKNAARKKPTVTVQQVPDTGAPAPSRGGSGTGIGSGGAMARGMPTSGLPSKRGSVAIEEIEEQGYKRGGSVQSKKIGKVMREYKAGKLHSGSKKGPVVKNPKQAMAIALSEARRMRKAEGGLASYEESGSAGGSNVGFKEAFRKAREQGLKEFSWKGDRYSTKLKEQSSSERKVEEKAEPGRKGPLSRGGKRNVSEMSEYKRERKMELPSDRGTSYRSQGDDTGMSASERAGKAREYAMDIATAGAFGKAFKGPVKDLAKGAMRKASEFVGGRKLKQAAAERAAREATPEYKSKAAQMEKFAEEMRARQKMGARYAEGGEVMSKGPKTRYTAAKGRRQARERAMEKWAEQRMKHAEMYAPGKSLDMSEYKKGGKVKHADVKMDKEMMKKAVHKHERAMHPGKPLTKLRHGGVPAHGRKPMYGGGKC